MLCCSVHATVITKRQRKNSRLWRLASLVSVAALAGYFGMGGCYAHLLIVQLVFDPLFREATSRLANGFSRGESLIIASGLSVYAADLLAYCVHKFKVPAAPPPLC